MKTKKKHPKLEDLIGKRAAEVFLFYCILMTILIATACDEETPDQYTPVDKEMITAKSLRDALKQPERIKLLFTDELTNEISLLTELERLSATGPQISEIPVEILDLKKLVSLSISNTQVEHFPAEIWQLPNLELLEITNNKLNELPDNIASLKNVESFFLYEGGLQDLPNDFSQMPKLKDLIIWINTPEMMNKLQSFASLSNLSLNLNYDVNYENSQSYRALCTLDSLEVLAISNRTNMSNIPDCLCELPMLRRLEIEADTIVDLPLTLVNCENLKIILRTSAFLGDASNFGDNITVEFR